jgi:hypothetical protein
MNSIPNIKKNNKLPANERGAALITTLLVSTLLLIVGGALLLTTSMNVGLAIDTTSELQAYYSAEAGVNATLNVLRRNVDSNPSGTPATFRNAVTSSNLNSWLNYDTTINGASAVSVSTSPVMGYAITVVDPDGLPVTKQPTRLLVTVTGYGPRGASKRMQMMVDRFIFDYSAISTILIRGHDNDTTTMGFAVGQSSSKIYSGFDSADPASKIPVIGVSHTNDFTAAVTEVNNAQPGTINGSLQVKRFLHSELPTFLQTADNARAFLNGLQSVAVTNGRYFGSSSGSFGTVASPQLTFVDGDCSLTGGAGLLVVTGTLHLSGGPSFRGLILVLGQGFVDRNGGGSGDIMGAFAVARFARSWPASENGQAHPFLEPTYDTSGSGDGTIGFDSDAIAEALSTAPARVVALREN